MESFVDASSYCQHIKSLSDQLTNVGALVSNNHLVLQLVSGLSESYSQIGSQIRHSNVLPPIYKAHSMLILEETARAKKSAQLAENSVMFTTTAPDDQYDTSSNSASNRSNRDNNRSYNGVADEVMAEGGVDAMAIGLDIFSRRNRVCQTGLDIFGSNNSLRGPISNNPSCPGYSPTDITAAMHASPCPPK